MPSKRSAEAAVSAIFKKSKNVTLTVNSSEPSSGSGSSGSGRRNNSSSSSSSAEAVAEETVAEEAVAEEAAAVDSSKGKGKKMPAAEGDKVIRKRKRRIVPKPVRVLPKVVAEVNIGINETVDRLAGITGAFDIYAPSGPSPWGDETPDLRKTKLNAVERQWIIRQIVQKKQTFNEMATTYNMKYQKIYNICGKVFRAYNLDMGEGRGRPHLSKEDIIKQGLAFTPDSTCPWGDTVVDLKSVMLTDDQKDWFARQINDLEVPINNLARRYNISYQKLHSYANKIKEGLPLHPLKGRPRAPDTPAIDLAGCPWGKKTTDLSTVKLLPDEKDWLADQVIQGKCNVSVLSRMFNLSYQKVKSYYENKRDGKPFRSRREEPLIPI